MISAILLAAGQSKRMNGENKLTKKIQDIPLIKHSVKNILSSSIDELIVVLGYQKEIIEKLIGQNKKIKTVLIGIPTHPQKKDVDIFIPVGTPGLDHNSHLLRIDKVVSLPLKKIRNISLPSVDYVLNKAGEI